MTALASASVDRSSLSKSPLVIDSEGFSTYYFDQGGLGRVGITPRETFATPSPFVHGQFRTSVVKDETDLLWVVRVQAGTSADLETAVADLEEALWQWAYPVTVTVSGVVKVWTCAPAAIQSTDALIAVERVRAFHEDLAISIPVYPVSA